MANAQRSVRTDVIIYLPGGRNLVIDSKVSLTAYTDCVSAADEDARKAALKSHLTSVRRPHLQPGQGWISPSSRHRGSGFRGDVCAHRAGIPHGPAKRPELWADAYKQGILLVGPTTLLYVIRIVNVLWQQELQARNVQDVMNRGAELYDKFVGFVTRSGSDRRRACARRISTMTSAMKKLAEGRGNLIRQVEMLKELGIRTSKSIPTQSARSRRRRASRNCPRRRSRRLKRSH